MTGAEHGSVGASGSGDRIPFGSLAGDAVVRVAPRAAVGGTVPSGAALSRVGFVAAVGVGALGIAAFFIGEPRPLHAAWRPAQDLSFRVSATPDTITVGDPIDLELEGSAPTDLPMLWPELADSVGSFAILEITPPVRTEEEGRAKIHQTATLTLYRAGAHELPAIPLLAVQGGDTLVAYGATPTVVVRSLLPADDPNLQNPQTALAQLKDLAPPPDFPGEDQPKGLLVTREPAQRR